MGPSIWCSTYRAYGVCHSASALWQKQFIHFSYLEGCRRTTGSRCYTTGLCDRPCENRASCITIVVTMFASTLTVSWIFRRRGYILRPWEAGFRDPDCHQGALGSLCSPQQVLWNALGRMLPRSQWKSHLSLTTFSPLATHRWPNKRFMAFIFGLRRRNDYLSIISALKKRTSGTSDFAPFVIG